MKTFREFFEIKLQEQGYGSKPAIRVSFSNLSFGYQQPVFKPKFSQMDKPDLSHTESRSGKYSGMVEIPIQGDAKDQAAKMKMNLKEFIEHVANLDPNEELYQKFIEDAQLHLYDLYNADFSGEMPPGDKVPDGLYEEIDRAILDKFQKNDFEVIYA